MLLETLTTIMTTMMTKFRVRLGNRYWRLKGEKVIFTTSGFDPGCSCKEITKKEYRRLKAVGWRKGRFKRPFPEVLPGWWLE